MADLRSPWINVVAATLGGVMLGIGLVRLALDLSLFSVLVALGGLLLLWWALGDRRRLEGGHPESEEHGRRTVE